MNKLLTLAWSLIALTQVPSAATAVEKVATFSALPKGDELEIVFQSNGCFHSTQYALTFRHEKRTGQLEVVITQIKPAAKDAAPGTYINAVLEVAHEDVKGLDQLLVFYRSKPPGGCTTIDQISIKQHRDGKIIAQEEFTDGSCAVDDWKGRISIQEMIRRAESKPVEEEIP